MPTAVIIRPACSPHERSDMRERHIPDRFAHPGYGYGVIVTFSVDMLSDAGAGEIAGLDCSRPLDAETLAALNRTMLDYPVTVIRNQSLTAKQQVAFSRQLGPLETQDRKTYCHPDDPDILILSNEIKPDGTAVGVVDAGDFWHSDSSHLPEPCRSTVLYAVRNPTTGGDTEYCNMYQVYDALSPN